jgi:putative radical SAM enzyme (TIGR03279 family)
MEKEISAVVKGSIAEEIGIEVCDKLISINNNEVNDIIDYKYLISDENISVQIQKYNGETWDIEIEKEYDEGLGIEFKDAILDEARSCCNKCVFCFVDQLPKGLRNTLYFKDDDSRLSFLQGNFVTLTNMSESDIERIIKYKISPINVSVHTTNPALRVKMLNNKFAGNIYEILKRLSEAGIKMNCQIVLCLGINNGDELAKTANDLYNLYPSIQNVAVVPVGITKYREGLFPVKSFNKETSLKEIEDLYGLQQKFVNEIGEPFIRLSDEFYILAEKEVPDNDFYGQFEQLEDGVGMIRLFRNNLYDSLTYLNSKIITSYTLITGSSAFNEISKAAELINDANSKIKVNVVKILNNFFGKTITVAGLLTGKDIIDQLKNKFLGDFVIIPSNMLRSGENIFLDDITLEKLSESIEREVLVCDYTGADLIDLINLYGKEEI